MSVSKSKIPVVTNVKKDEGSKTTAKNIPEQKSISKQSIKVAATKSPIIVRAKSAPVSKSKTEVNSTLSVKKGGNQVVKKQKNVTDRRGISEIKRSEQNLQSIVMQLEEDIKDLKLQIDELEKETQSQYSALNSMEDLAETLKEENENLVAENSQLCSLVEEKNIDPVTKKPVSPSRSTKQLMKTRHLEGYDQAKQCVVKVQSLSKICSEASDRLNRVAVKTKKVM